MLDYNLQNNIKLWQSRQNSIFDIIIDENIEINLIITVKEIISTQHNISGKFINRKNNVGKFIPSDYSGLNQLFTNFPKENNIPCKAVFRIDYENRSLSSLEPGEYMSNGEIIDIQKEKNHQIRNFKIQISQHYMVRKARQSKRLDWKQNENSFIRLYGPLTPPKTTKELQKLFYEIIHEHDKKNYLLNISNNGALINVDEKILNTKLLLQEYFLLILLLNKHDKSQLPFIFLTKKIGIITKKDNKISPSMRIHFERELDWSAHFKNKIAWIDISKDGSQDLDLILNQYKEDY